MTTEFESDFTELTDHEGAKKHPGYGAFVLDMKGRLYGHEALNDAWAWFEAGWEAAASPAPHPAAVPTKRPLCMAPTDDSESADGREAGYCDVFEGAEGPRCTRVCAVGGHEGQGEPADAPQLSVPAEPRGGCETCGLSWTICLCPAAPTAGTARGTKP